MEKTPLNQTWQRTCATCKYCGSNAGPTAEFQFVCRRNPPRGETVVTPTPTGQIQVQIVTVWPMVQKTDWCGDFDNGQEK